MVAPVHGDDFKQKKDRYALAVTYVDAKAEVREEFESDNRGADSSLGHEEDRQSFQEWIGDVECRKYFEHPLVPLVWPQNDFVF
mmetsp:Transcript_26918/g.33230  ORF Transcript_26918/g.33230 Transcript_26918/m.33230 type:complete len:84 (+) Transcript_26918:784-1035(+)